MRLYIVRHGIAIDREEPDCPPEAERFLTIEGVERTREAMRGLRAAGARPDAMATSPYVRAVQTAEIAASLFDLDPKRIRTTDALLPAADPKRILAELARTKAEEVACFGHAPHVDELIAAAVGARGAFTEMKKAGAARLDFGEVRAGGGTLVALYPVGVLRKLG
jgi:phosphohistidine phosphatase